MRGILGHIRSDNGLEFVTDAVRQWNAVVGARTVSITVAEREPVLPRSLTKRLVNHARPGDAPEGYIADWSVGQLRESA